MQSGTRCDPRDTIVALATPPGPAARAIVRLSGPAAPRLAEQLCADGALRLPGVAPLPAELYVWRAPRSYTGQDMAELHTLACPPLVDLLIAELLRAGARPARPGEFTLRAFLAGKLDLTRAEAVLAVIEAGDRDELTHALKQLAGGVGRPLQELRDDLLNLLADVEAGLDFADEDIRFVEASELLLRLGRALAIVTNLQKQMQGRALARRPFRVALAGRPNAGKSSLFNALTAGRALVSPEPGTTRDYLVGQFTHDGETIELLDTAGSRAPADRIEASAQAMSREQLRDADLVLCCIAADAAPGEPREELPAAVVELTTQCDRADPPPGRLATSARTGAGLEALRRLLVERARARKQPALAPSLSRCAAHVQTCLACLRRAHAIVIDELPAELLALELREALAQLGQMVGAVYTDDLLDRIFSRFCIGK